MSLTIGNIVALVFIALGCTGTIIFLTYYFEDCRIRAFIISILIFGFAFFASMFAMNWYNTDTASGKRSYKDFESNMSNGIEREITITAEDGREIFYYEGKVDIESDHEDNYIKFEGEDGKRYLIYYGIQDTITIIEK